MPPHWRCSTIPRLPLHFGGCPAAVVASRNWQATAARTIIAPFIFIALIWVVNEALTTGNNDFDPNRSIPNPKCGTAPALMSLYTL